jgi:ATP-dependent Lhr-like helicase
VAETANDSRHPLEWCDRRLLARIHRYTLNRLRADIEPVSPAGFMRFLFAWQHVDPPARLTGIDGLRAIIGVLDGFELAASAWERAILPARLDRYEPTLLDMLCLTGEVGWARLSPASAPESPTRFGGATPIALFLREHAQAWQAIRLTRMRDEDRPPVDHTLTTGARRLLDALRSHGASFLRELAATFTGSGDDQLDLDAALGELAAAGLVTSDGFAGLRAIVAASGESRRPRESRSHAAGRWSTFGAESPDASLERAIDMQARSLLYRYGVVFRRLLTREANAAPWRELTRVYRRLEARGEIRGGRFVSGMSGEQFALPDAVERLREIRRTAPNGRLLAISAADPLNLAGIITTGDRVRAAAASRVVYRDGVPVAALEGDYMRPLTDIASDVAAEVATVLTGRRMPAVTSGFVGGRA